MAGKNKKARGLGRGLDALFADQAPVAPAPEAAEDPQGASDGRTVLYLDINEIKPNVNQPRKNFDPERIAELADSIREHGIIQPLVVRPKGAGYEIVAGERRYRAAREAGLPQVPCLVREYSDEDNMLIAIIENMQREDLNPIEEAQGLNEMIRAYGMTQEEVSRSVSKSRPYITNSLRLLKLPQEMQTMLAEGKMGGWTRDMEDGAIKLIFDAAENYRAAGTPLVVLAGKMYGSGGEFTENIDRAGGAGTAAFAAEAIDLYCRGK